VKPPKLILQDCLLALKALSDDSLDSLVTDPPAGISFMGNSWDHHKGGRKEWVEWMAEIMREALRVMKPGAHGLVWALPRTSHWTATALEDAGFEIRDVVTHLFGSGFPKSLDVSKAIDKAAGAERARVPIVDVSTGKEKSADIKGGMFKPCEKFEAYSNEGITDAAKQWQGFGTALKPASEHWILVRKPCSEKTVAANVLKWGCGALNIDASRIGMREATSYTAPDITGNAYNSEVGARARKTVEVPAQGRFPANLVFSHTPYCTDTQCDIECAVRDLDAQSGTLKSGAIRVGQPQGSNFSQSHVRTAQYDRPGDSGSASRFFYVAKISKAERNAGLEGMPLKESQTRNKYVKPSEGRPAPICGGPKQNHHPTVKPKKLMTYLIRMVTPPGGTVLDPFMGSGSTGLAAGESGFSFVGIEKDPEYFSIASKRVSAHEP
jgi:DNA modification methylase